MSLNYIIKKITHEEHVIFSLFTIANNNKQNFLPPIEENKKISYFNEQVGNGKEYYCLFVNEIIAGIVVLQGICVQHIYVVENFRGKNIGTTLLDFLKERHEKLFLYISRKNELGVKFYLHNDFVETESSQDELKLFWSK